MGRMAGVRVMTKTPQPKLILTDEQFKWLKSHRLEIHAGVEGGDRKWIGRFKKTSQYRALFGAERFSRVWKAYLRHAEGAMTMNAFQQLWTSTETFFDRFDKLPPKLREQSKVFNEELAEFKEATLAHHFHDGSEVDMCNEAADLIVTICGVLMSQGQSYHKLVQAMQRVAMKNNAKTHETHVVDATTGKITRKQF